MKPRNRSTRTSRRQRHQSASTSSSTKPAADSKIKTPTTIKAQAMRSGNPDFSALNLFPIGASLKSEPAAVTASVGKLLRQKFGITRLRAGQDEVIKSVLAGHDTLAIMPTGSGKS